MVNNYELIKFIFGDNDAINSSKESWEFLNQIINAKTKNFKLDVDDDDNDLFIWIKGIWKEGQWENGIWEDGTWKNGTWENGYWEYGTWENGMWHNGTWHNGIWYNGTWLSGKWHDGIWKGGIWKKGYVFNSDTKKYKISKIPPNKCKWSLSYGK